MFRNPTRGRHGAPKARRIIGRTRPACGPIPVPPPLFVPAELDDEFDLPSMDLPDGYLAQRPQAPGPLYVEHLLPKASAYREHDVVVVTGGVHVGRRGIVDVAPGGGRPLVLEVDGGQVYVDEGDVQLVRRPADEDTETFATVHVAVPVTVVGVEHADGTPVGYWLPGEDAPTLTMAALDDGDELAQFYDDLYAEDAAQPESSMEDKLEYAAVCAASGNPLMRFEREIMGLPLDADDVALTGGAR